MSKTSKYLTTLSNRMQCAICGTYYDVSYKKARCRWCKGPLTEEVKGFTGYRKYLREELKPKARFFTTCKFCGKLWYNEPGGSARAYCDHCKTIQRKYIARMQKGAGQLMSLHAAVAKNSTGPLTEQEWSEIVEHFGGCALCGSPDIAVRHYLIPYREGGGYNKFNVIPLCVPCDKKLGVSAARILLAVDITHEQRLMLWNYLWKVFDKEVE